MKQPVRAAVYCAMFPAMSAAANQHGYALAVHGSLERDFDVIAVPWIDGANSAYEVSRAIAKAVGGHIPGRITLPCGTEVGNPMEKPRGRLGFTITIGGGDSYIDLSVIP